MSRASHTIGDWYVDDGTPGHVKSRSENHRYIEGVGHSTPTVARFDIWSSFGNRIEGVGFSKEEEQANGHLISAAPDFYAEAVAMCERHDVEARQCNFERCGCENCKPFRPIIAKARGES